MLWPGRHKGDAPARAAADTVPKNRTPTTRLAPEHKLGFIRQRQLDGTLFEGRRVGSYVLTALRVCVGWGMVSEKRWPRRKGDPWPPPEPPGLDDIARHNRWQGHFAARDLDEICTCLKRGLPVQLALPIHGGWSHRPSGMIELPKHGEAFTENHSIVVEECDERLGLLKFWNNWGSTWGKEDMVIFRSSTLEGIYTRLGYRFLNELRRLFESGGSRIRVTVGAKPTETAWVTFALE
jgi:hypothetical protein